MRVLYVTLFPPELNLIPAQRTAGMLKYLPQNGVVCDVLTRYYSEQNRSGINFSVSQNEDTFHRNSNSSIKSIHYVKFVKKNWLIYFWVNSPRLIKYFLGFIFKDIFHYGWLKGALKYYKENLEENNYDFVVASYSPLITLIVAKKISRKYNIPWIAEFRDSYIGVGPESRKSIFFKKILLNNLLNGVDGIISICQGIEDELKKHQSGKLLKVPFAVVNNGIDFDLIQNEASSNYEILSPILKLRTKGYTLLIHTGTIYEGQDLEFFIDFIDWLENSKSQNVYLVLAGLTEDVFNYSRLRNHKNVVILPKMEQAVIFRLQNLASALIIPAWYKERYTGFVAKVFEYVHSGIPILCSPNPPVDLSIFLKQFDNVIIPNSFEEAFRFLNDRKDKPHCRRFEKELSRQFWVNELSIFLFKLKKD